MSTDPAEPILGPVDFTRYSDNELAETALEACEKMIRILDRDELNQVTELALHALIYAFERLTGELDRRKAQHEHLGAPMSVLQAIKFLSIKQRLIDMKTNNVAELKKILDRMPHQNN